MHSVAQTAFGGALRVAEFAVEALLYLVADTSGAIVEEVIVAIDTMFGLAVEL